jgi:hypothetical protein
VVAAAGAEPDAALVEALQRLVRSQLAPYETPKEIEFVDALPMTATGKIQRSVLRQLEADRASGAAPPMAAQAAFVPDAQPAPPANGIDRDEAIEEYALREPIPEDEDEGLQLADEED